MTEMQTDVLVVGGGLGGVAAALSAAEAGRTVVLSEVLPWLGGQLTAQAVPVDEHPWAEHGIDAPGYRRLRQQVRQYYRDHFPLTPAARSQEHLNPGAGNVSGLCHEPQVAAAVLEQMLAPYISSGRIWLLRGYEPTAAQVDHDRVSSVTLTHAQTGDMVTVSAQIVIDATELGDLLPLAHIEHVIGAEAQSDTQEPHALERADPLDQQAITWCFAADYCPGEDHVISRPEGYETWREVQIPSWPGPQFSWTVSDHVTHAPRHRPLFAADTDEVWAWDLWHARRIAYRRHHDPGFYASDITVANWPQMDYWKRPVLGVGEDGQRLALAEAKQLSQSFLYWMQTEAPRHDGGTGYPGLRLRPQITGTADGFAMQPYYRESRRIVPEFRVLEQHIGVKARAGHEHAEFFTDSIGIGAYRIDIHPSTTLRNTVDIDSYPFQIPLGALIPVRIDNVLAAAKNIGTTRITNGAYREHPTEWSIGEAAGLIAAQSIERRLPPRALRTDAEELEQLQQRLRAAGISLSWPTYSKLAPSSRKGWVKQP